jgi:phytoene synthase
LTSTGTAADYCHSVVRRHDKDRYLASLFIPDEKRPHIWALYAFNYEIARIREITSAPAAGEVRLQWWVEMIEAIYSGSATGHPLAGPLSDAIEQGELPKSAFLNTLEARRFDLYDDPMPSLTGLEGYLGETSSSLIQLASLILAGRAAGSAAAAAGLAGVAYGLTGLLRSLPLHRARGQSYLPKDRLEREGLAPEDIIAAKREPAVLHVLHSLIGFAQKRLGEARELRHEIPAAALPAFLPVSLVDGYLAALSHSGLKMLDTVAHVAQWRRQLRLLRMARRGQF